MNVKNAVRELSIIQANIIGKPDDLAHVSREVGQVVDCIRHSHVLIDRLEGIGHWVQSVAGKTIGNFLVQGCVIYLGCL